MPGRCGSPTSAISGNRASRPLTSVPSGLPAPGWTTSPAGLSITIDVRRRRARRELDRRVGLRAAPRPAAAIGSIATTLALASGGPCRCVATVAVDGAPPAATSAAASARLAPVISATIRSSRSPAERRRDLLLDVTTSIDSARVGRAARNEASTNSDGADVDADVGDVEDREPLEVDEVDDRAVQPARRRGTARSTRLPSAPPISMPAATRAEAAARPRADDDEHDDDDERERRR